MRRRLLLSATVAGAVLSLAGCGFALREAPRVRFQTLFANLAPNSRLLPDLRRALAAAGDVEVITDARQLARAQVVFEALTDRRERVVVATTAAGQVREFQLRVRLRFRVRLPDGRELIPETELLQQRDLSYNESAAVAKESEEALLYRDMQQQIVEQVVRQLAAIRLP